MANEVTQFRYPGPSDPRARDRGPDRGRSYDLVSNDTVISTVQVMQKGQSTGLHSHTDQDGYWLVLAGKARFFDEADGTLAELGTFEGVFIPRRTHYGFTSVDDEPLQVLRVSTLPDAGG